LNENTGGVLDLRLGDMARAEREARAPLLVIAPTSINDGRRVIISAQPVSFLTSIAPEADVHIASQPEAIEFRRLFAAHRPDSLKLTSALRMNASFPYITPITTLPSEPPMRVMDAGVRDNYGYRTTLSFLHTFRRWIAANTSGVVVVQLRDTQKQLDVKPTGGSLLGRALDPIGSVYDNFVRVQDQDYDLMLKLSEGSGGFPLQLIDLQLRHDEAERISLSWHLTKVERERVLRTVSSPENKAAFEALRSALMTTAVIAADATPPNPGVDRVQLP
ncbi:MAG TPA: hypothetical protein PK760_12560, partial [Flavobacteriales bacterium]|nr:hypothetical protein [Flavobacteriales bacterium]